MLEVANTLRAIFTAHILIRTFGLVFLGFVLMWTIISSWEMLRDGKGLRQKLAGLLLFLFVVAEALVLLVLLWNP
jgi:hypothetical protein